VFHELLSAVLKELRLLKTSKMFHVPRSAVKDYLKGKDTDIERR
jgi:predicted transcriptional regulator